MISTRGKMGPILSLRTGLPLSREKRPYIYSRADHWLAPSLLGLILKMLYVIVVADEFAYKSVLFLSIDFQNSLASRHHLNKTNLLDSDPQSVFSYSYISTSHTTTNRRKPIADTTIRSGSIRVVNISPIDVFLAGLLGNLETYCKNCTLQGHKRRCVSDPMWRCYSIVLYNFQKRVDLSRRGSIFSDTRYSTVQDIWRWSIFDGGRYLTLVVLNCDAKWTKDGSWAWAMAVLKFEVQNSTISRGLPQQTSAHNSSHQVRYRSTHVVSTVSAVSLSCHLVCQPGFAFILDSDDFPE